ncbi:hypothetical protein QBE52_09335 [Clostridiaceae bacterium 35-E11]
MTIRPVDFQGLVPKIQRLSQENQQINNKEKVEHQHFIHEDKKNTEQQLNKINKFEGKAQPNIRNNDEGNKNKKGAHQNPNKKKRNHKENDHSKEQNGMLTTQSKLDIRI